MKKNPSTNLLLRALRRALAEAGAIHRRGARRTLNIDHKGLVDIVTDVDRAAEKKILGVLRGSFPDHGFLMEESGLHLSSSRYRWVVDPLDGTVNFAHRMPISCVSIGLEKDGRVLMGGVYDPFRNEEFLAVRGKGAALNGKKIRVSKTNTLINALLVTGFPYDRTEKAAFYLSFVEKFMKQTQGLRRLGAAALDMAYVAAGRFDGYWEFNLKPWDAAAGRLLVEEAGGRVTNFLGRPYSLADTSQTLASNGQVHGAMLRLLAGSDKVK
ncbi:MAG: inositol monophosphatase [Elusimicrobia bacterium]|nr:inositol monophosphatase [Elusimicrobiota bacterium]MBP9127639.1 inositol monophosphatase [Elusimicrobiota bacterium]